jgi:2,5-diamino-6-(ribosylamino)-4(3H)-pyrimidinone 5'-phosphate reductase
VSSNLPLPAVLRTLREKGIRSIMVEGGARIIQSFLASPSLVDALIVTMAPILIGREGVGYSEGFEQLPGLKYMSTRQVGRDTVVGFKLTS